MNNFCPQCGAPLTPDARFCSRCGRPVTFAPAVTPVQPFPPTPSPRRRSGLVGPLLTGLIAIGLCLCVAIAGAVVFRARGGTIPGLEALLQPPLPAETQVAPQTLQALEDSVNRLEAAFRSGDVDTVINLTHPAMRSSYHSIFQAHQSELSRVADLLATRRLVHVTYEMAEYAVTENGRTFSVIFEPWGEQWYLSAL